MRIQYYRLSKIRPRRIEIDMSTNQISQLDKESLAHIDVPKPLTKTQVQSFVENGFLAAPGMITADELEELCGELEGLFRDTPARPAGRLVLSFRKEWYPEIRKPLESRKLSTVDEIGRASGRESV